MRRLYLLIASLSFAVIIAGNNDNLTEITFSQISHDFGIINLHQKYVTHTFYFRNTGQHPLLIKDVRASCGCTEADWTRRPVTPGDTGSITVLYKNWSKGIFHKRVKVISNAGKTYLYIKGDSELLTR
jgi:hypothetical protein